MNMTIQPNDTLTEDRLQSDEDIHLAARALAQALVESAEFQSYEAAADRLRADRAAQATMTAFQEKQQSLQALLMLNAVSPEKRAELERLRQAFLADPCVMAFMEAQERLTAVCQAVADLLSNRIGLNFAAACGPGCC